MKRGSIGFSAESYPNIKAATATTSVNNVTTKPIQLALPSIINRTFIMSIAMVMDIVPTQSNRIFF